VASSRSQWLASVSVSANGGNQSPGPIRPSGEPGALLAQLARVSNEGRRGVVSSMGFGPENQVRTGLPAGGLEGDGFEPSVPGTKEPVFVAEGELRDRTGQPKLVVSYAVPMVRIQQRTCEGVRRIASELGCSRMTVRRYLARGRLGGLSRPGAAADPDAGQNFSPWRRTSAEMRLSATLLHGSVVRRRVGTWGG
jgi:hypothetical protein